MKRVPMENIKKLKNTIELIYEEKLEPKDWNEIQKKSLLEVLEGLDQGKMRISEKKEKKWITHAWLKKAILLYFKLQKMKLVQAGDLNFFDKIPLKKWTGKESVRIVPHALVRKGAYIAPHVVLMPSYVNIGAYVDSGSMIDTWATVGSCAQVGKGVHVSGGVGIGGVLEPLQALPVIIEDDVFIGSRSIVVEGVQVAKRAVLGAGVVLTASTKIIDVQNEKTYKAFIPEESVVIPGSQKKSYPAGDFFVPCALIIGKRTEHTNKKTALTETLRKYNVSV